MKSKKLKDGKKMDFDGYFIFPMSTQGIQTVSSIHDLQNKLRKLFREATPQSQDLKFIYRITYVNIPNFHNRQKEQRITARCSICNCSLIYKRRFFIDEQYRLSSFMNEHVHNQDVKLMQQINTKNLMEKVFFNRSESSNYRLNRILNCPKSTTIIDFVRDLPSSLSATQKCKLVCHRYKIGVSEYESLARKIQAEMNIPFRKLVHQLTEKGYEFRYLPAHLLEVTEEEKITKRKQYNKNQYEQSKTKRNLNEIDALNPDLPHCLVIVSPHMRQLFLKYGQYIGFDLTFSIIREKPQHSKQYLIGAFAGTNQSRRVAIYGLVLTNSQSVEAYKFIFKQFFNLMGSEPQTIITDEEKLLYYALRELKDEGDFHGEHYFDMFHILKKFRKSSDTGPLFSMFRRLIHSKDRFEYREIFNQIMQQVSNDKEVDLIRTFDRNSHMYCYSQIPATYVGIGISDSVNQHFHHLIKRVLPLATTYSQAVITILRVIDDRNALGKYGQIQVYPWEERLNMSFLRRYRPLVSDMVYQYMIKEISKSGQYSILSYSEMARLEHANIYGQLYIINAHSSIFSVYRKAGCKWECYCQFAPKSGIFCSHMAKVLLLLGEDLLPYIHNRLRLQPERIEPKHMHYEFDHHGGVHAFDIRPARAKIQSNHIIQKKKIEEDKIERMARDLIFDDIDIDEEIPQNTKEKSQTLEEEWRQLSQHSNEIKQLEEEDEDVQQSF